MEEEQGGKERIFVGGLGGSVTEDDLQRLFTGVGGSVHGIDIIRTKGRSFAYVDFLPASDKSLPKLFATYNGCAWKGGRLKVHKAKEHYLVRMRREWAELEAAQLAAAAEINQQQQQQQTIQIAKSAPQNSNKQLRLFFPALRTVKALPFSGTGKHKYSFQRLQEPSLPLHFCDCEAHAVSDPSPLQLNQLPDHVINAKEHTIMNKVMDKLLQTEIEHEHVSDDTEHNTTVLPPPRTQQHHEPEAEEHDLIINIASTKQEENILSALQDLRSSGSQVRSKINPPPKKKRKSLVSNNCNETKLDPDIPAGKMDSKSHSNKLFGAQPDQQELGIQQSTAPVSWSQKCPWKQLVGHRDNCGFSVSRVLTGRSSTDHMEPKYDTSDVQQSDSRNQDLASNLSPDCELSEMDLGSPEHKCTKSVSDSYKSGRIPSSHRELSWTQLTDENAESVTEHAQPISGAVEVPHSDNKNQDLAKNGDLEGQLSQMEPVEDVEPQPQNAQTNPTKSGRGAAWRQKSSWTQLINDNSASSFSITQVLPAGITFKQQGFQNPKGGDVMSSFGRKLKETVKQDKNNLTTGEASSFGIIGKEGGSLPQSSPKQTQQIRAGNDSACVPDPGKTCDATPKQASTGTLNKDKTCLFVRSAASLNEWAKAKAALSGSRKRKNINK